jgi:hypothetical protein
LIVIVRHLTRTRSLGNPARSINLVYSNEIATPTMVDGVALRLYLPAQRALETWQRLGHLKNSAAPSLRWAAEWSQRDHFHQSNARRQPQNRAYTFN